ncbi:MAG: hypothetical protein JW993_19465 [Sedimentisphaerales bacterium]|nr:hypothetical protein [Sedimentisphaerales bacterium]
MKHPKRLLGLSVVGALVLFLVAAILMFWIRATASNLKEVSAFDLAQGLSSFGIGQRCPCSETADPNVTTYPSFKSDKPIYGSASFAGSAYQADSGLRFCFALDESGGTGQGYDRLYFDSNRDLDLTNDPACKRLKDPPDGATLDGLPARQQVCFEYADVPLPFGSEGAHPLEVMPRLYLAAGGCGHVAFVTTRARRGQVTIAGKKFTVLLGHNYGVTGWFDQPWTALHLMPERGSGASWWGGDRLMATHKIGDTFYRFAATPAGDKLTVRSYDGPLGTLEVGAGGRSLETMAIEGSLQSEDTAVPIGDVLSSGLQYAVRTSRLPVGDYHPSFVRLDYGSLRIGLSNNYHADGQPRAAVNRPPVYGIRIRTDKPFVFDFSNPPEVMFALPGKECRIKRGEELMVKAVLIDPVLDFMIRELHHQSESGESTSLDPSVVIARADGTTVAEGVLPFG